MKLTHAFGAFFVAGLVCAPIAAQAGERAGSVSYSAKPGHNDIKMAMNSSYKWHDDRDDDDHDHDHGRGHHGDHDHDDHGHGHKSRGC